MPNGSPLFVSNGDTLFVQANVNADKATIYGLSANLDIRINDQWRLQSGISYTRGRRTFILKDNVGHVQLETLVPQDHIPPIYGQTQLSFQKGKFTLDGIVRYNGAKREDQYAVASVKLYSGNECGNIIVDREGTADNIEQGVLNQNAGSCESPYLGVYGWATVNFYTTYQATKNLTLNLAVENIADVHYRYFSSGLSAPGRNIILAFKGKF